jgi:hypothetical protein
LAFILTTVLVCTPLLTQAQNPYQTRNPHFGVSGGNINDISRAFCCSGTLGSLVTAGGTQYVLSNNHVLARQDQATTGEDISQPGWGTHPDKAQKTASPTETAFRLRLATLRSQVAKSYKAVTFAVGRRANSRRE